MYYFSLDLGNVEQHFEVILHPEKFLQVQAGQQWQSFELSPK
jgi:hypothetical protein